MLFQRGKALETADAVERHCSEQEQQHGDREQDRAKAKCLEATFRSVAFLQAGFESGLARGIETLSHKLRGTS